jgi:hypothetical protein
MRVLLCSLLVNLCDLACKIRIKGVYSKKQQSSITDWEFEGGADYENAGKPYHH